MQLTNLKCKNAKPKEKPYKIAAGGGLYLEVMPNGSKYWRMKYRFLGKEKRLALGVYDLVGLEEAYEKARTAKKLLNDNKDPALAKKEEKRLAILNAGNTFEVVAREWHQNQLDRWTDKHAKSILHLLETDVFPDIGNRPIADIDAPEVLETLRRIEKRDALYLAGRVKQICGQIFRYGIATGRGRRDPAADLKGALRTARTQHYATITTKEMPPFLQALERNDVRLFPPTRRAIWLLMLTFVRTNELINASWNEFDLEKGRWEIPPERMKMRKPHVVPLSHQAIILLREQKEEIGHLNTQFVFPNRIDLRKSMSNNTILSGIRRLGYKGKQTGHGFRALARTAIREELRYDSEIIEKQLAHRTRNPLGEAYDRTQFLDDRKKMMQDWADYLDIISNKQKQ